MFFTVLFTAFLFFTDVDPDIQNMLPYNLQARVDLRELEKDFGGKRDQNQHSTALFREEPFHPHPMQSIITIRVTVLHARAIGQSLFDVGSVLICGDQLASNRGDVSLVPGDGYENQFSIGKTRSIRISCMSTRVE